MQLSELIKLRHELHRFPEISNKEIETSKRIESFIMKMHPDSMIKFGETGRAFVFNGKPKGKTILFRAELDALAIDEKNDVEYASQNKSVAHSCGHDGHMAILSGFAQKISEFHERKNKIVILFQPAEELEQGARDVVESENFKKITPDFAFALHNIPGVPKNKILYRTGTFAAASKGMTLKLFGKTSHAAEPENGVNPAEAIAEIIQKLNLLLNDKGDFIDLVLLTIIHVRLGEPSFGTSPGYAEMMVTFRSFENEDMENMTEKSEFLIKDIAEKYFLRMEISYSEVFPATINYAEAANVVEKSIEKNNFENEKIRIPFRWSEDFAYFSEKCKTYMFGLGAGEETPALHNPDYDFPDDILQTGIDMFWGIFEELEQE